MNDDALARLMVTEITDQEKEERLAFIGIKRREVECHEREVAAQGYRARQEDIRFYLLPYDHLTGEQGMAMDEARAVIKAKFDMYMPTVSYNDSCELNGNNSEGTNAAHLQMEDKSNQEGMPFSVPAAKAFLAQSRLGGSSNRSKLGLVKTSDLIG
ncbi:hypothetical protein Tco_0450287 [Tanacetum coccineum]